MSVKPKILVVIESLDVNDSSGTKGRVALLHSFLKAGYDVTALHYTQKDIELPGIQCVKITERKGTAFFIFSRIQRLLYRWFKIDMGKRIDSLFGFSFTFFNDFKSLAKGIQKYNPENFDMIWTLSKGNSYRPHKAVLSLPQWHSIWYAYVHDPYPQQLYPRPYNYVPYGYKQKRRFFRDITIHAKRVVFPSLFLKEWMESYYVKLKGKSLIVPHQIVSSELRKNISLPDYFDSAKFTLLHGGNLLDLRDPKPLVEAFVLFLEKFPEAKQNASLVFLGKRSIFSTYLDEKSNSYPQIFASDGYVPFSTTVVMQNTTTINIILEAKSEISPFLPGKFPYCVGANKPILLIGPYYSECKRLLGEDYKYSFDFEEIGPLSEAIGALYEKWKQNPKQLVLARPDLESYLGAAHLKEVLTSTSSNHII